MSDKVMLAGAQRMCGPGETLERMAPYFAAAGISRVGLITGMDRIGIPVAQCVRPDAALLSVDSGKGATREQAMCSAVMEGFERHVGETWRPAEVELVDCGDVNCEVAFPRIEGSGRISGGIECAGVRGIASGKEWMVPVDVLRMRGALPAFSTFCSWSNGLSAGNTLNEALAGGLYEVIERDAVHMGMMAQCARRVVELSDAVALEMAGRIEGAGCRWILLDATTEMGVPVYEAYIYDFEDPCVFIAHGSGAHLSPGVAQVRALCEAAQARAVWLAGSRDDIGHEKFHMARCVDARMEYDRLAARCSLVAADVHADRSGGTFAKDVQTLVDAVMGAGMREPLWVSMGGGDFPCWVVRVLGPGLAGYFGHGCKWGRPV